jgi:hypothetical protein
MKTVLAFSCSLRNWRPPGLVVVTAAQAEHVGQAAVGDFSLVEAGVSMGMSSSARTSDEGMVEDEQ